MVLVAGKGRDNSQKYGNEYVDYPTDVEYVLKYLKEYNMRK